MKKGQGQKVRFCGRCGRRAYSDGQPLPRRQWVCAGCYRVPEECVCRRTGGRSREPWDEVPDEAGRASGDSVEETR